MALPFPLVTPSSEEKVPSPQVWGFPPGGDRMWYSTNPKSCLSKLPTLHPHGFKVQSSGARDGDLCETPPNFTPGKRGGRAPGVRNSWRSVLRGLSSCPAWSSRLGLGLHMLDTGQDFLLVSGQSDSNSEQILGGDLADQLKRAEPSCRETFFVSPHFDGSKPLAHRAKSRVVRLPLIQERV